MSSTSHVSDFEISAYITGNHRWIKYSRDAAGEPVFALSDEGVAAGAAGRRTLAKCCASYKAYLKQQRKLRTQNTATAPRNADDSEDSIEENK